VGAIARAPLPGYFGNSAGATAYFMAYATGALPQLCRAPWTSTRVMLAFVVFTEMTTFRLFFKLLRCQDLANAMLMCCPHHLLPDICCWYESYSPSKAGTWSAKCAGQSFG